jgi:hypothetical protein
MPRANRYFLPGHIWHITHRCHQKKFLLKFARDRRRYLHWVFEAKKRFGLSVLNYRSGFGVTHQDQGCGEVSTENFFPPLATILAPENCRYHAVAKVIGFTDPWLTLLGRPTQVWLTAWANHLIKSSPSCLDFRDGTAANQTSWL